MSNDKQETIPMGKTVMVLVIPEPKVRKATAKPVRKHKDKTAYSRKAKHKALVCRSARSRIRPPSNPLMCLSICRVN